MSWIKILIWLIKFLPFIISLLREIRKLWLENHGPQERIAARSDIEKSLKTMVANRDIKALETMMNRLKLGEHQLKSRKMANRPVCRSSYRGR
jgi:hypothetical protein